jgi:two-component system sensor histidine kinase UhpB
MGIAPHCDFRVRRDDGCVANDGSGLGARRPTSLLARVMLVNVCVLLAAGGALIFTPATVSNPVALGELVALVAGVAVLVIANLFLLRRAFSPLQRLTEVMARVDHLRPGIRIPVYGGRGDEIEDLTRAFNDMLDRLEAERRSGWQRAAEAQESERTAVARELHDEVGQSLTAMKLLIARAQRDEGRKGVEALEEARRLTDETIDTVRGIARRLRPEALDELGLEDALTALARRNSVHAGIPIDARFECELPDLDRDLDLAIYRVAQESITNVLRHSRASAVRIELESADGRVELLVADDGVGLRGAPPGNGIKGMKERALGLGGRLEVHDREGAGTEVRLTLPVRRPG